MPNRIIREGFLDSERIDALPAETERLYHRLLLVCDDAGRFDGRPAMIAARCYPLKRDLRASDVARQIAESARGGLLIQYEHDGKTFIQLTRWAKCGKSLHSRYPWTDGSFDIEYVKLPTRDGPREFVTTSVPGINGVRTPYVRGANGVTRKTNTETETETETETASSAADAAADDDPPPLESPPSSFPGKVSGRRAPHTGPHHDFIRFFGEQWAKAYPGCEFIFSPNGDGGENGNHVKFILDRLGRDEDRAHRTVLAYLRDRSEFLVKERHPIRLLRKDFNKYQAPKKRPPVPDESVAGIVRPANEDN